MTEEKKRSTAKSYTQYSMYKDCPRKYKLRYLDKVPDTRPKQAGAVRGTNIHDHIEHYFDGTEPNLPAQVAPKLKQELFTIKNNYEVRPEEKFCFNKNWELVDWDAEDGMLRGVIDLIYLLDEKTVKIEEWKSGRIYPDHPDQRGLYGMASLIIHPQAEACHVHTRYLDQKLTEEKENEIAKGTYTQTANIMAKAVWEERLNRMDDPSQPYIPMPSFKCRWCPYSKPNGGPCEFS